MRHDTGVAPVDLLARHRLTKRQALDDPLATFGFDIRTDVAPLSASAWFSVFEVRRLNTGHADLDTVCAPQGSVTVVKAGDGALERWKRSGGEKQ